MNRTTVIAVVAGIAVVGLGFYLYSRRRSSIGDNAKSGVEKQHVANGTPSPKSRNTAPPPPPNPGSGKAKDTYKGPLTRTGRGHF